MAGYNEEIQLIGGPLDGHWERIESAHLLRECDELPATRGASVAVYVFDQASNVFRFAYHDVRAISHYAAEVCSEEWEV